MSDNDIEKLHEKINTIAIDIAITKTKVDNIEAKLTGNGSNGLCRRVDRLEQNEIRRLSFSAGVTATIIAIAKWLKII